MTHIHTCAWYALCSCVYLFILMFAKYTIPTTHDIRIRSIRIHIHIPVHTHIHRQTHTYVHKHLNVQIRLTATFTYTYIYVYDIYIYIYIYILGSWFASPLPPPNASTLPTVTGMEPLEVAILVTVVDFLPHPPPQCFKSANRHRNGAS